MVEELITLKNDLYNQIYECRVKIANLEEDKINIRAVAWKSADGVADAKKDYVKSQVSNIQNSIDILEADIEFAYNSIKILDEEIELRYLGDE